MYSSNVKKVIENLKKVLPMAVYRYHLNMQETRVNIDHVCGTVHCVGGWYAIAKGLDIGKRVTFMDGANEINKDLGFSEQCGIKASREWAVNNPKIWGNVSGYFMFSLESAYYHPTKRPNGALNLQHVIDHWQEVYDRLLALEMQVEISDPPVYVESFIDEPVIA